MHHTSTDGIDITVYDGTTFYNFTYTVQIKPDWGNIYGLVFNFVDNKNYYRLELDADPRNIALIEVKNSSEKTLASATYTGGGQGVYSMLKVTNNGKSTEVEVNGKNVFNEVATTAFRYGKIGLYAWYQPVWYDDVEVNAESKGFPVSSPILNAEDVNGLKCFPNPLFHGDMTIKLASSLKNIRLEIYSFEGQTIWTEQKVDGSSFSVASEVFPINGLYIIKVIAEKYAIQDKILYFGN